MRDIPVAMGVNMTRITFSQLIAGALFSLCLATAPARARANHTYVSGKGADTGTCTTPATACRTFAFAIAQTEASGSIIAIDPANYSPVTITKSISIVADGGGPAGIFIATGTAITITPGAPGVTVVNLRGLTLDGAGQASAGISSANPNKTSLALVKITDCFIRHFTNGIIFAGTQTSFVISNTVSSDNAAAGLAIGGAFSNGGVVDHFTADSNDIGISMGSFAVNPIHGVTDVTIVDSVITNNGSDGLFVGPASSTIGTARLAGSVVTLNGIGVNIGPGSTVFSYGDNEINGNGIDVKGTLTPLAKR
jgi:hypothetical protein